MATFIKKDLENHQIELTVTVPQEELVPFLEAAAEKLNEQTPVPGFRAGKAPFEIVKQRVGELKLLEAALDSIIRKTYIDSLTELDLATAGSPRIDIEKMAPGNELVYRVTVAQMPKVLRLADEKELKIPHFKNELKETEIDEALVELSKMQTKETRSAEGAVINERQKAILEVDMKKDGVAVEGGQAPRHVVYLDETHYIPGFIDALKGLKEGDQKTFTLPFPEGHYMKHLAGAPVDFEIVVKELYDLHPPTMNEEFAASLGQESMAQLRDRLRMNMQHERDQETESQEERVILEEMAKASRFEEIPEVLIQEEIEKMMNELRYRVEQQGGEFDHYLASIKKTIPELRLELATQALTRVQVALVLQALATRDDVNVSDEELDKEIDRMAEEMQDKEEKKALFQPHAREHMRTLLTHRKVVESLRVAIGRKEASADVA